VVARTVEGRTLYVNTTPGALSVAMPGAKSGTVRDVLTGRKLSGALDLAGYGVALVE
jgi:beta-galactosidase